MRRVTLGVVAALAAVAAAAGTALATQNASHVNVKEKEFKMTSVPVKAHPGKVTFVVKNNGHLKHEFIVVRVKKADSKLQIKGTQAVVPPDKVVGFIKQFGPGKTKTLTVKLKAGHYILLCNLPAHYAAGQHESFTIG